MAASLLWTLGGCATAYQPLQIFGTGGYTEEALSEDTNEVAFYGNGMISYDTIKKYLFYRMAELTVDKGYDWFEILPERSSKATTGLFLNFRVMGGKIKMYKEKPEGDAKDVYSARELMAKYGPEIKRE
jgi:hypothetical protein